MAQYKATEDKSNSAGGEKAVVDLAKYKQADEPVSAETSAFEQVMSQMNIADRSAFDKHYSTLWNEASNEKELLSVFICEIDFFKAYNDNYGHQGASFMLLVVGLALKNTCEKYGCYLARYENEDFAILMKGGDEQQALEVAESLRQAVEASRTEHKYSEVSNIVTLSVGISSIYPNAMHILMQQAGAALNDAIVAGRNQVCCDFPQATEVSVVEQSNSEEQVVTQDPNNTEYLQFQRIMAELNFADRTSFHHNYVKLWKESAAEQELLSMITCEVDCFQSYRDHYGKQASEDVLLIVACALLQVCEEFDCFAAHFEDERFVILIKGGNATKALKIGESLQLAIEQTGTEHKTSDVDDIVTMSMGLSSLFPSDLNSMKMLMAESNTALKVAMKAGKNQISVH